MATTQHNAAVVIYSGGMDSYTLLNRALRDYATVLPLTFNYGQRHVKEIDYAARVAQALGLEHKVINIAAIGELLQGSALTSDIEVPLGHYEEQSMKTTVVPNRNMIMLSLAVGYAVSREAGAVFFGAHAGDHAIYPDCRPVFVEAINQVTRLANYHPVEVRAPYLYASKGEILAEGLRMRLDYRQTWTCYNGRTLACGRCGACVERLEAFALQGVVDPIEYETLP
ncbi:MAG: 7-cyano-7-deazaguanine synthase QueC [Methylococcales bacterium]|nr:7-cyano-7-deazaguanine synthase QueC [Methylococcales bacterium]